MPRVLPSSISPGISAIADMVAGIGPARAAAEYKAAQMENLRLDNERQAEALKIQQDGAALARERFQWEQGNQRLMDQKTRADITGANLGNQAKQNELGVQKTHIASLPELENVLTEAVVGKVKGAMPEWNLKNSLTGAVEPEDGYLPGVVDSGANFSSAGMNALADREEYIRRAREQIAGMAHSEVYSNPNVDEAKWIDDTAKSYSPAASRGYRPATPEEKAAYGVDPKAPLMMTPDGKPDMISGTTRPAPQVGSIPAGYELVTDQATGASRLQLIAGGPEDQKAKAATANKDQAVQNSAVANDAISRSLERGYKILDGDSWYNPAAGFGSGVANWVPGSNAVDFTEAMKPVNANNAFEQLAQMRAASPNGGALGAISEKELALLEAARASLSNAQSEEQLRGNMDYLWNLTQDAIYGWDAGPERRPVAGQPWESPMKALQHRQDGSPMGGNQQGDQNLLDDRQTLINDPSPEAIADFNSHYGPGAAERILGGQ